MNLTMGSQVFHDVEVPILWGTRAIVQDTRGRLSVVNLDGEEAVLEILADKPAKGVTFSPRVGEEFAILDGEIELYTYNAVSKTLSSLSIDLPDVRIDGRGIQVGGSTFAGNTFAGFGVGIVVTATSISLGAPLPPSLAKLRV